VKAKAIGALDLDRVIHERARLVILSYIASSAEPEVAFTELRDELGFSGGNLSIQLKTLVDAGYLRVEKRFKDNKPFTGATLTAEGARALSSYLAELEVLLDSVRSGRGAAKDLIVNEGDGGPDGLSDPGRP
jgi:DNA-binding MarR family transcriptional regulator